MLPPTYEEQTLESMQSQVGIEQRSLSDAGKTVLGSLVQAYVLHALDLVAKMAVHSVLLDRACVREKPVGRQWADSGHCLVAHVGLGHA